MQDRFSLFASPFEAGVYKKDVGNGIPFEIQTMNQVHGVKVFEIDSLQDPPEADALICAEPGICLMTKTADCIPLVIADHVTGYIAAIHAGWRGLTAGVILKTLAELKKKGVVPGKVLVGVGPSLRVCCAEFSEPFREIPAQCHFAIRDDGHVDLPSIALKQLLDFGVLQENIEWSPVCTACSPDWFSWRRDKNTARFGTWVRRSPLASSSKLD